jgi:ribosomal protein S18 acetylase RimI-like enzyme
MSIEIIVIREGDDHLLINVAPGVFDDPIDARAAAEFIADPRHYLIVARDAGAIVGFISGVVYVHPDKPRPELWINEIGVAVSHHRKRVGSQMISRMLELAKEAGCSEAWVLADESNSIARQFYRSIGGNEHGERSVMYTFPLHPGQL